jgi:aspartyl-tRNA(Asn)/glutamyl-tRNA(Gln) amidotransferase subunit A
MHTKTILELLEDLNNNVITYDALATSAINHLKLVNDKLYAINSYCDYLYNENKIRLLYGIAYVMKDLVATKDILTTSSSYMLKDFIPEYSATIYNHFLDSNALMIAKSNLDQFGMGGTNMNSVIGFSRNPYNTDKGTGGSSGGSAAVVSAGCVPFAIGTDTGDSVRLPAALCGIYGFKPTWTTISRYGVFPYASSLDQVGVFTRCVDDIALVMETLNGPDKYDMTSLVHQKEMFYKNLKVNDKPLKIGYVKELVDCFDNEVVINQFNETIDYLKSLNHEIVELNVPIELLRCARGVYQALANSEASSNLANLSGINFGYQELQGDVKKSIIASRSKGLMKYTKARLLMGAVVLKEKNKEQYFTKTKQIRTLFIEAYQKLFEEVDILVAPCCNGTAINPETEVRVGSEDANLIAENHLSITNLVGSPGITIPTHFDNGLPLGMSFMTKPYDDQLLLNFAKQFENGLLNGNYKSLQSFYNVYVKEVK